MAVWLVAMLEPKIIHIIILEFRDEKVISHSSTGFCTDCSPATQTIPQNLLYKGWAQLQVFRAMADRLIRVFSDTLLPVAITTSVLTVRRL